MSDDFKAVGEYLAGGVHNVSIPEDVVVIAFDPARNVEIRDTLVKRATPVFVGDRVLHLPTERFGIVEAKGRATQQAYVTWEIKPANPRYERTWVDLVELVAAPHEIVI